REVRFRFLEVYGAHEVPSIRPDCPLTSWQRCFVVEDRTVSEVHQHRVQLGLEPFSKERVGAWLRPEVRIGVPILKFDLKDLGVMSLQPSIETLTIIAGTVADEIDVPVLVSGLKIYRGSRRIRIRLIDPPHGRLLVTEDERTPIDYSLTPFKNRFGSSRSTMRVRMGDAV